MTLLRPFMRLGVKGASHLIRLIKKKKVEIPITNQVICSRNADLGRVYLYTVMFLVTEMKKLVKKSFLVAIRSPGMSSLLDPSYEVNNV